MAIDWKNLSEEDKKVPVGYYDISTIYESFKRSKIKLFLSKKL